MRPRTLKICLLDATSLSPVNNRCLASQRARFRKTESAHGTFEKLFFTTYIFRTAAPVVRNSLQSRPSFADSRFRERTESASASRRSKTTLVFSGSFYLDIAFFYTTHSKWCRINANSGGHGRTDCHAFTVPPFAIWRGRARTTARSPHFHFSTSAFSSNKIFRPAPPRCRSYPGLNSMRPAFHFPHALWLSSVTVSGPRIGISPVGPKHRSPICRTSASLPACDCDVKSLKPSDTF